MSSSTGGSAPRRGQSMPPDRLAAVLDEVDRARRTGGWTPEEPTDRGRRATSSERIQRRSQANVSSASDDSGPRHLRQRPDDAIRPHTPLIRPPRSLQDSVLAPGRLAVVAVLVLVLMVGAVLGGRVLWMRATSEPRPVAAAENSAVQGTPRGRADAPAQASPSTPSGPTATTPTTMLVHVVGQVARPGVVTLSPGARVSDALKAAGGARSGADLARLNLARPVTDGEQVAVPKPGEELSPAPGAAGSAAPPGSTPSGADSGDGGTPGGVPGAPVNLNQADASALEQLPGVGPVIAGRIVQWRTDNGQFTSVDELTEVSGIGEKMLAQLRPHVAV